MNDALLGGLYGRCELLLMSFSIRYSFRLHSVYHHFFFLGGSGPLTDLNRSFNNHQYHFLNTLRFTALADIHIFALIESLYDFINTDIPIWFVF